jgi:hypothetical protein
VVGGVVVTVFLPGFPLINWAFLFLINIGAKLLPPFKKNRHKRRHVSVVAKDKLGTL